VAFQKLIKHRRWWAQQLGPIAIALALLAPIFGPLTSVPSVVFAILACWMAKMHENRTSIWLALLGLALGLCMLGLNLWVIWSHLARAPVGMGRVEIYDHERGWVPE
jgi:hypothetical protein